MKQNDWKERLGVVFSTNPDYVYEAAADEQPDTLPPARQRLRIRIERAGRRGKTVTLVTGFVGNSDDLKELGRQLKAHLGTGGTSKDGVIVIQGDVKEKVVAWLRQSGYGDVK